MMSYSIKKYCLGCHYCALECPSQAIHYKGTQYQIDPEKCTECGLCVTVCNIDAIDTGIKTQVIHHESRELTADVVVVGAGAGGTIAAVRAAQLTGGKIIVLEKAKKPGGSGWYAGFMITLGGGPGGPGGPPKGPSAKENEADAMVMEIARRDMSFIKQFDQELVKNAQESQFTVSEWLAGFDDIKNNLVETEMFGRKFTGLPDTRLVHNLKCTDHSIGPGRGGSFVIHTMLNQFKRYGIELLTEHRATKIVVDSKGTCTGVVAEDPGGITRINCKAVILLSGGFAQNDEMLKKYAPWFFTENDQSVEPVHRFAAPTCTGDIVGLGESAGAYIDHESMYVNLFGPVHHPFTFSLFRACLEGEAVVVNLDGKRFFNEGRFSDGAKPICFQKGRISYALFSEDVLMNVLNRLTRGMEGKYVARYPQDIAEELADNNVSLYKCDTLEEIAAKTGIVKKTFIETIERYNSYCETGIDKEFGKPANRLQPVKKGPYYAIFGKMATDGAFGGVLVNCKTQVYKDDRSSIIPGLYAAGDCAAGLALAPGGPGDNRRKAVGDMGWGVGGGFLAATNAAEYLKNLAS
jgi:fumarate reductase flavoprotein subunit